MHLSARPEQRRKKKKKPVDWGEEKRLYATHKNFPGKRKKANENAF